MGEHSVRRHFVFNRRLQHLKKLRHLDLVGHGALYVTSSIKVPLVNFCLRHLRQRFLLHGPVSRGIVFRFTPVYCIEVSFKHF